MTPADRERLAAAREKKRRKLERYINTPAAASRRMQLEREFAAAQPMTFPPTLPELDF